MKITSKIFLRHTNVIFLNIFFQTEKKLRSGHDISDGGLIVCLLEMAFAGNCGLVVDIPVTESHGSVLILKKKNFTFLFRSVSMYFF